MLKCTVVAEHEDTGYYYVVPEIGVGTVKAVDVLRLEPAAGDACIIVQIGEEYGLLPTGLNLPAVIGVPAQARDGLAIKEPAQFFCAYLGAQLGRFRRVYYKAEVLSVGTRSLTVKYKSGDLIGKIESVGMKAGLGLAYGDFDAFEEVAVLASPLREVVGWWEAADFWANLITGIAQVAIQLRNSAGAAISAPINFVAKYGRYEINPESPEKGVFYEYDTEVLGTTASDGIAYVATENEFILLPNDLKIEYSHGGVDYAAFFSMRGGVTTFTAVEMAAYPDGSFSLLVNGDGSDLNNATHPVFDTTLAAFGRMPAGSLSPAPLEDPIFFPPMSFSGSFNLDAGNWSASGGFSIVEDSGPSSGNYSMNGKIKKLGLNIDEEPGPFAIYTYSSASATISVTTPDGGGSYNAGNRQARILMACLMTAKPYIPEVVT